MKVEFQPREDLAEIGGNYLEYSLLVTTANNGFKGCHAPFVCKDFLTDIFWGINTGKEVKIYSFKFDPSANFQLFDRETYYLGIRLRDTKDKDKHLPLGDKESSLADFLNQLEDKMGIPCSSVNADETGKILVIDFFPNWLEQPHLISLFTLLIRVGIDFVEGNAEEFLFNYKLNNNNTMYISQAKKAIEFILGRGKIHKNFSDYATITNIHSNSGIVSCANIDFTKEEVLFVLNDAVPKSLPKKRKTNSIEEDAYPIPAPGGWGEVKTSSEGFYSELTQKMAKPTWGAEKSKPIPKVANKYPYIYKEGKVTKV